MDLQSVHPAKAYRACIALAPYVMQCIVCFKDFKLQDKPYSPTNPMTWHFSWNVSVILWMVGQTFCLTHLSRPTRFAADS